MGTSLEPVKAMSMACTASNMRLSTSLNLCPQVCLHGKYHVSRAAEAGLGVFILTGQIQYP